MGYTGARVGEALSRGFAGIGDALYTAAQNAEQRRRYEATNAENQRRYDAGVAWDEQREATRQAEYGQQIAEDQRRRLEEIALQYGPGAIQKVPEVTGSLVGQGGVPVAGTEMTSPADYLINPAGADPAQTWAYRQQDAENTQELAHMGERADMMAGRGLTYSGGPLAGPAAPEGPPMLRGAGQREFADTPEGRQELLAWQEQYGTAGRKPEGPDIQSQILAMALGQEPPASDAGPRIGGRTALGAQEVADEKQPITADQAEYLRAQGMSDEEIDRRYVVRN